MSILSRKPSDLQFGGRGRERGRRQLAQDAIGMVGDAVERAFVAVHVGNAVAVVVAEG